MAIARDSDYVVSIVVARYPPDWQGMSFDRCYHCHTDLHVKSGGCWTVKYARSLGIAGDVRVVSNV